MTIVATGINHKTADLATRERIAVNMSIMYETLHDLLAHQGVQEAVVVSTCNRTEIIAATDNVRCLLPWVAHRFGVKESVLREHAYQYHEHDAVKHLMRVATGLDSMILGEPQILGQVKQAYQAACDAGSVGSKLMQLFPAVFEAAKKVRQETELGAHAISLAYLVCQLARQIFTRMSDARLLFVGASDTNALIAEHLQAKQIKHMVIANRSLERAEQFAARFNAQAITMPEISDVLSQVDIVITATASQLPILGKGAIEQAQKQRKYRPMLLVDLAVPRDIEKQAKDIDNVFLYNMDDLQHTIANNKHQRKQSAEVAEALIDDRAQTFMRAMTLAQSSDLIRHYRQQMTALQQQELQKALQQIEKGESAKLVLETFSRSLLNKFLHQPTLVLRDAIENEQIEKINWFRKWFNL